MHSTIGDTVFVKNAQSPRAIIYVTAILVPGSFIMLLFGYLRGINMLIAALFAIMPLTGIILPSLEYFRQPIGVAVNADGIRLKYRGDRIEAVRWKDVIEFKTIPLFPAGFHRLGAYREDGRLRFSALSKEPSDRVWEELSGLWKGSDHLKEEES